MSLRGRALAHLARREHSRHELARKLRPHADSAEVLEAVLDALEQAGHLSQQRFVESLVRRRADKFGLRRIAQELEEHRLPGDLKQSALRALRETDTERAWQVWERRFGQAPTNPQDRARQQRFLAARGFGGDAIATVFRRARSGAPAGAVSAESDELATGTNPVFGFICRDA